MGAPAIMAGAAAVGAGASLLGVNEARKGNKLAKKEANAQRAHQAEQATLYKAEQAKAAERESIAQRNVQKELIRGSRRRIRGGLFGDADNTGIVRNTLGA